MRTALLSLVVSVCLLSNALALNLSTDVDFFSFTGWNHGTVTGAGQVFNDVAGTADLTVTAAGTFTLPSKVKGATDQVIVSGHTTPGSNTFTFNLSEALPIVIVYQTVDSQEKFTVMSSGTMSRTHIFGGMPMVTLGPGSLQLMGVGTGVGPAGSSRGYILTSDITSFQITHEGTKNNKFEAFRIGTVVPEPSSLLLGCLGFLPMLLRRRG